MSSENCLQFGDALLDLVFEGLDLAEDDHRFLVFSLLVFDFSVAVEGEVVLPVADFLDRDKEVALLFWSFFGVMEMLRRKGLPENSIKNCVSAD